MVDINLDPEQLSKINEQLEKSADSMRRLGTNTELLDKLAPQAFDKLSANLKNASASFAGLDGATKKLSEGVGKNVDMFAKLAIAATTMTGLTDAVFPASKAFDKLGASGKGSAASITESYDRVTSVLQKMPGVTSKMVEGFGEIMPKIDQARDVENALLRIMAQSGNLGETMKYLGSDFQGLEQLTDNFSKNMEMIANRTGLSTSQVTEFATSMKNIPGFVNTASVGLGENADNLDLLSVALKISRGTMIDMGKVEEIVSKQMSTFGGSTEDALQVITRMHSAAGALVMPFDTLNKFVDGAAESFMFFGNQSQGALEIMNNLAPALKEGGLAPEAISQMVGGITKGISQLDIAQKAFISSQSGGPGGLMGGFQIEQLMREGKTDQVFDKMQVALKKQFGGGIVDLKEAGESAAGASQMQRQISFMRQGPLGGMVKDDQQAIRLLEAMKSGTGPGGMLGKEEATEKAINTGNTLQKRQTTILNELANKSERLAQIASRQLYLMARQAAGAGSGPKALQNFLKQSDVFAANEIKRRTGAEQGRAKGRVGGGGAAGAGAMLPIEAAIKEKDEILRKGKDFAVQLGITAPAPIAPMAEEPQDASATRMVSKQMRKPRVQPGTNREISELVKLSSVFKDPEGVGTTPGGAAEKPIEHVITVNYRDLESQIIKLITLEIRRDGEAIRAENQGVPGNK